MLESYFNDPETIGRLRLSPLGPYLESLEESLVVNGYTKSTIYNYLRVSGEFGQWLEQSDVSLSELDEKALDTFLEQMRRQGKYYKNHQAAIRLVLDHLREEGVVPRPRPERHESASESLLHRYEDYVLAERGLIQRTVDNYKRFVRLFLEDRFGDGFLCLRDLNSLDVQKFMLRQAESLSCGNAKAMVTSLRSFFHFLLVKGEIDIDLAASVLTVVDQQHARPPKYLETEEVERLLETCDRNTAIGRRDYAILVLLARLGLRAGEVGALELDDIHWREGEITVPGKGLRRERLPLPSDVGEAIAVYLHQDRPLTNNRRVFVRATAPHRGFGHSSSISTVVRRALKRSDLHPPRRGAHLFRHSLATGMIRYGASMAEIAQLLRHRSLSTTELYAKVDFGGLRSLVQPWPDIGGGQ